MPKSAKSTNICQLYTRLIDIFLRPSNKFDGSDTAFGRSIQDLIATVESAMHFFAVLLFSSFSDFEHSGFIYERIFSMKTWDHLKMLRFFRMFMDYPEIFSKEHHFDAMSSVLIDQYNNSMYDQTFKQFLIAAMVHVKVKRGQVFPPDEREAYVTVFPDPKMMSMIYDILQCKQVFFSGTILLKKHNKSPESLDNVFHSINSAPNKIHKDAISKILELKPDFFKEWQPFILEYLHSGNDVLLSAKGEKKWIESMQTGCPEFLAEMQNFRVEEDTIRWIFFYTIQWNRFGEFKFVESLEALMNHLVFKCPMPFPFMSPPKIFTKDYKGKQSGDREVGADPTKWSRISVCDLKKIFFGMRGIHGKDIFLHENKACIKHLSSLLYAFRMRQNAMSLYAFQLKYAKALPVIQEGIRKRIAYNSQRKSAAILILLAIKRRGAMENFRILKAKAIILLAIKRRSPMENFRILKAAAVIERFVRIPFALHSRVVHERLRKFVKDLSCYDCPLCFENFDSVQIGVIQPCGHIHCKDCFAKIGTTCSNCRAKFMHRDCKSVSTFLSQSNPKFFFTMENSEKKDAISVIGWAMKRRLVAQI